MTHMEDHGRIIVNRIEKQKWIKAEWNHPHVQFIGDLRHFWKFRE